jgi:hypothetical protein
MMMKENRLLFRCMPLLLVFLQREKRKNKEKKWGRGKKSKQHRAAGQTRCCMLRKKRACEREMQCEEGRRKENVVTITNQRSNDDQR